MKADNALVFIKKDIPLTTSLIVAEGTENEHKSVIRMITKNKQTFERWGKIYFSDLKSPNKNGDDRGRPTKVALLNEQQATFLVTLLRNNETVIAFKSELVDQFYQMREKLRELAAVPQLNRDERWQQTRLGTKQSHKPFTKAIQLLIPYLRQNGDTRPDSFFYGRLTNLIQNDCGVKKGERDNTPVANLNKLDQVQDMVGNLILQILALRSDIRTMAQVEATIQLQLNQLNSLLSGQFPMLNGGKSYI